MNRYIAFLRGINISGKNKIPMAELKSGLERIGFQAVKTHLNSGNVVFSACREEPTVLASRISAMIKERFALDIPVYVLEKEALEEILEGAPDWWGTEDKGIYDNLIFVMPPCHLCGSIQRNWSAQRGAGTDSGIPWGDLLVLRPGEVSENQLVVQNGKRRDQPPTDHQNGKYRPEID